MTNILSGARISFNYNQRSSATTYGDSVGQRFAVDPLVRFPDVTQVDLGPAHDDPDELTVVGADARHGGFQLIGVVVALLLRAFHCNIMINVACAPDRRVRCDYYRSTGKTVPSHL